MIETAIFHLDSKDVRKACIENNWYTAVSCKDYSELLDYADEHLANFDSRNMLIIMAKLEYIAEDIQKHTDWDENQYDCTVSEFEANIVHVLLNSYARWTVKLV